MKQESFQYSRFSCKLYPLKVKSERGILLWYGIFMFQSEQSPICKTQKPTTTKVSPKQLPVHKYKWNAPELAGDSFLLMKIPKRLKINSSIKNYSNQLSYVRALQRHTVIWPSETLLSFFFLMNKKLFEIAKDQSGKLQWSNCSEFENVRLAYAFWELQKVAGTVLDAAIYRFPVN